ncbi:MAG: family 10 glycosylhydrolase [Prevotella sp.]|nr:family 10 glycosylhydrolase [Prevotella sp.]
MNRRLLFILLLSVLNISVFQAQPKREFRGAWIQCVNGQFIGLGTEGMQQTLRSQLDELQRDGVNAVIFQVRAECDAMYPSNYEPWSRFLTGQQGVAPQPYWDPLKWMIDECHKRGMELHAWINPYRAKTKTTSVLASSHIANTNPERVFKYDDQYILNPGQPENREYICKIATDITRRYDIDGFHIDDYFYPYPAPGQTIQDDKEFQKYNNGIKDRGDWRRYNVNLFIKQLSDSIHAVKPWVKFGVSPFGIYRNKKSATIGSQTSGMQNYDDLYADVLLWVNNGWVDYCVPQLYWQVGHSSADYEELIKWWNRYASNRPLYIGEDVERTVKYADPQNPQSNQLPYKRRLHDEMKNVDGTVLWYAKSFVDNTGNYAATMRTTYWRNPALQPLMPFIDAKAPKKPRGVKPVWTKDGYMLFWRSPRGKKWGDKAAKYVVYRFNNGENINISNPSKIVNITAETFYKLPYEDGKTKYTYIVTALDRMSNESKIAKKKIKL